MNKSTSTPEGSSIKRLHINQILLTLAKFEVWGTILIGALISFIAFMVPAVWTLNNYKDRFEATLEYEIETELNRICLEHNANEHSDLEGILKDICETDASLQMIDSSIKDVGRGVERTLRRLETPIDLRIEIQHRGEIYIPRDLKECANLSDENASHVDIPAELFCGLMNMAASSSVNPDIYEAVVPDQLEPYREGAAPFVSISQGVSYRHWLVFQSMLAKTYLKTSFGCIDEPSYGYRQAHIIVSYGKPIQATDDKKIIYTVDATSNRLNGPCAFQSAPDELQ